MTITVGKVTLTEASSSVKCDPDRKITWKGMPIKRWRELGKPAICTSSELWFTQTWLFHPHRNWKVDLDALNDIAVAASLEAEEAGQLTNDDPRIYAGVLIRHVPSGTVYRLTGVVDDEGLYQGVWPD